MQNAKRLKPTGLEHWGNPSALEDAFAKAGNVGRGSYADGHKVCTGAELKHAKRIHNATWKWMLSNS